MENLIANIISLNHFYRLSILIKNWNIYFIILSEPNIFLIVFPFDALID